MVAIGVREGKAQRYIVAPRHKLCAQQLAFYRDLLYIWRKPGHSMLGVREVERVSHGPTC